MGNVVLVIGQAPPKAVVKIPFQRTRLYRWMHSIGLTQADVINQFAFTALVNQFPGKRGKTDRIPSKKQIVDGRPELLREIAAIKPKIILAVGIVAIREVLQNDSLGLVEVIGKEFRADPFGEFGRKLWIIPLPHPSGANPWIYVRGQTKMFQQALRHLEKRLNSLRVIRNSRVLNSRRFVRLSAETV